jgi:hypothetical protein
MSFCFINIFYILNLFGKMRMKVQFPRKVHNTIQIDRNIERVQNKQQDTNREKKRKK